MTNLPKNPQLVWGELRAAMESLPQERLVLFKLYKRLPAGEKAAAHHYIASKLGVEDHLSLVDLLRIASNPLASLFTGNSKRDLRVLWDRYIISITKGASQEYASSKECMEEFVALILRDPEEHRRFVLKYIRSHQFNLSRPQPWGTERVLVQQVLMPMCLTMLEDGAVRDEAATWLSSQPGEAQKNEACLARFGLEAQMDNFRQAWLGALWCHLPRHIHVTRLYVWESIWTLQGQLYRRDMLYFYDPAKQHWLWSEMTLELCERWLDCMAQAWVQLREVGEEMEDFELEVGRELNMVLMCQRHLRGLGEETFQELDARYLESEEHREDLKEHSEQREGKRWVEPEVFMALPLLMREVR